jgi:RHH-type proline utilization regulon transcriptional repressor/proline dehydrogenase/delta 1-pyrroline-5-carboxylate dehydrogenase
MSDIISPYLTQPEDEAVKDLLSALQWDHSLSEKAQEHAVDLIKGIRKTRRKPGSLESFFQQYSLDTKEGLALMSMAEALLRIPDPVTSTALIRDKVAGTNWLKSNSKDKDWMARAAGMGLKLSSGAMNSLFSRLGEPIIREAMGKAVRLLGKQFVVGQTLTGAMKTAQPWEEKGFRFSYDMLGEGARTMRDAEHYFDAYAGALHDLADNVERGVKLRPGISVKLSALYPRFEVMQEENCVPALTEKLVKLCDIAAKNNLTLTIDAEESTRLGLTLKIFENLCLQPRFEKWYGLGLAVQAYHKAAPAMIDHVISLARTYNRHLQIRLVKGAYWDTEIKHAQVEGHSDFPVFTRKSNTDLCYLRCVQKLLRARDVIFPMFGTHNAHTVAAIIQMAGEDRKGFEFQKLYGMGDALYNQLIETETVNVCVYAPVGPHHDLLPYLVRRMLENGANSSFVNQIYNRDYNPREIAVDPVEKARENKEKRHPRIRLPENLYGDTRKNSDGINFDDSITVKKLVDTIERFSKSKLYEAAPLIAGKKYIAGAGHEKLNPASTNDIVGRIYPASVEQVENAFDAARLGYQIWSSTAAEQRAAVIERLGDLLEENRAELMSLCGREGGRTLKDAADEVREAVDFCRYYAAQGRLDFNDNGRVLKGPTGEKNIYKMNGRGIFVCISPWNFPVAIYTGQIVAALMAGNAVIAKPAENTSLVGAYIAELIHKAGVPPEVFTFIPGNGQLGGALVAHNLVAGVAFTGSTAVAHSINKTLAEKEGPIARLIAETGGQNAMIVDSSALTEQVVDDVVRSAFGSAGQRCSACRLLYIQEDVADKTILMLQGAIQELKIGNPSDMTTDIGPLIDEEALMRVQHHKTRLGGFGRKIAEAPLDMEMKKLGHYFAPCAFEIDGLEFLRGEVFGPILHVICYKAGDIDHVIDDINATGYGLTFGVHSRIQTFIDKVVSRINVGNVYVNRGMTGAVVGVQPFGGRGLSGTGPKAGGPQYLRAFASEQVISIDTTAAGGNTSLVMLEE